MNIFKNIRYIFLRSRIVQLFPPVCHGSKHYTKFVIFSTERSGSSLLVTLLKSHSNITCFGEIFNKTSVIFSTPDYPPVNNSLVFKLRNLNPVKFIQDIIFKKYSDNKKAVGFKIHYDQGQQYKSVLKYITNDPYVKIIFLNRQNMLETFLSKKLAYKTGVWFVIKDEDVQFIKNMGIHKYSTIEEYQNKTNKISIDPKEFEEYHKNIIYWKNHYENMFTNNQKYHITYEDILNKQDETINGLLKFLEVKQEHLNTPLIKQQSNPLHEVIINYKELETYFSNSIYFKTLNYQTKEANS
jgi:LPS sulfotransferase NodH